MAKPPGRIHSREVWEGYRELVHDLYLKQNWKSQQVTDFLNETCGLAVTDRQVKNKIKDWKFNQKRTCAEFYRAMLVVANHRQAANGLGTVFQVPKKDTRIEVPTKRIKKEVDRQKYLVDLPSIEEARRLLSSKGYTWSPPSPSNSVERVYPASQDNENLEIDQSELWDGLTTDEEGEDGPKDVLRGSSLNITMDLQGPQHPIHTVSSRTSNHNSTNLKGDHTENTTSPITPTIPSTDDLINHALLSPTDEQKMYVSQWADPWFWHAFGIEPALPTSTADARDALRRLLREHPDNRYAFPRLSWMITVLGFNGKHTELKEFLRASCAVIDEETNQNQLYSSAFHFALACYEGNVYDRHKYGENFARSQKPMELIWSPDHPNVLINLSFWAWYLLDVGRYAEAMKLLECAVPQFERVMGKQDLLTINCRSILSRAYKHTGNYLQAIFQLEQALQLMGNHRRELEAVWFDLRGKLGEMKKLIGDLPSAEQNLRLSMEGRMRLFGFQAQDIWCSIYALCEVLAINRRGQKLEQLIQNLQQRPDCPRQQFDDLQAWLRYYHGTRQNE